MTKIANAAEDVDVMMTPQRSHVTKTKRQQTQPTPPQMILNFEETSAVADVDVAAETLHENLLQMVKPVNHDKLVSLEMPPKSLVQMAKIAHAAEDAAVTMTPLRNLVTTQRRKRLLMMLFLHFVAYFDVETVRPGSLLLMDRLVNLEMCPRSPVGADVAEDMVEETP